MKSIVLTGSSGAVGTGVALKLLERGHRVVCLDHQRNLFSEEVDAITVSVDLLDAKALRVCAPTHFDVLIHLAANPRVPESVTNPELAKDNFNSTFNVLELARHNLCRSVIFSSSKDVYGNLPGTNRESDLDVGHASSPYAATKIGCEALLKSYEKCYGIDNVIFRISNVYGKYSPENRVIPMCIDRAQKGEPLKIKGEEKRFDFVHINDVAEIFCLAVEKIGQVKNNIYNISSGESTRLVDLAKLIVERCESTSLVEITKADPGDVVASALDISSLIKDFGYRPKVLIGEGVTSEIEWFNRGMG